MAMGLKEELRLELSETKTLVTPVTKPMRFLGHHVRVRPHPSGGRLVSTTVIPRDKSHQLRETIKHIFRRATIQNSLANRLKVLNPRVRGWCYFYRHAWGAKHVFAAIDRYVWQTIFRWLQKKHRRAPVRVILARYGWRKPGQRMFRWRDGATAPVEGAKIRVGQYRHCWERPPSFASTSMESPVHSERCPPGLEGGTRKPVDEVDKAPGAHYYQQSTDR
jgi:hypothetical protein